MLISISALLVAPPSELMAEMKTSLCVVLALVGRGGLGRGVGVPCLQWRRVFTPLLACAPCGLMVFCLGGNGKKTAAPDFSSPPFAQAIFRSLRFISPCDGGGGSFNRDICLAEPQKEATLRLAGFV